MGNSKILIGLLSIIHLFFVYFEITKKIRFADFMSYLIVPTITLYYLWTVKNKNIYFLLFLLSCSFASLTSLGSGFLLYYNGTTKSNHNPINLYYYVGNSFYILGYLFLSIKIIKSICFSYVVKNYKLYLVILTILNIYLIYVLQIIVQPNMSFVFCFELMYNVAILVLLSLALLNYLYRDNKKSLFLFLGVLLLVCVEFFDIATIFVTLQSFLFIISKTLNSIGFMFLFEQSKLLNTPREEDKMLVE